MSDDLKVNSNATIDAINTASATQQTEKQKKNDEIGKEEFLTMLVAQLQSQDPMDPMKNEDFAVNLAQFSQLEQLIDIKNQLSSQSGDSVSSMASYLGHEVIIDSDTAVVKNGEAGGMTFELPRGAESVTLELLGASGQPVESIELGEMEAGRQNVSLKDLSAVDGEYQVRVSAVDADGMAMEPEVNATGVVSGFVPGAEPVLLVDDREVSPGEIKEVRMAAESV